MEGTSGEPRNFRAFSHSPPTRLTRVRRTVSISTVSDDKRSQMMSYELLISNIILYFFFRCVFIDASAYIMMCDYFTLTTLAGCLDILIYYY